MKYLSVRMGIRTPHDCALVFESDPRTPEVSSFSAVVTALDTPTFGCT
jgi:hypothetical protein